MIVAGMTVGDKITQGIGLAMGCGTGMEKGVRERDFIPLIFPRINQLVINFVLRLLSPWRLCIET